MNNHYEINGNVTDIYINKRDGTLLKTIIDTEDLKIVNSLAGSWYPIYNPYTESYYVLGDEKSTDGKKKKIRMHRLILGSPLNLIVDHINHDTLNNRRENLRLANKSQNAQNRKGAQKNSSSGIRGVYWDKRKSKWEAAYQLNGKKVSLGMFNDINEAQRVVELARSEYMEFSKEALRVNVV